METAIVARPAAVSAQAASARAESLVSNNRIRTELPRSATVNGTYGSSSTSFERANNQSEKLLSATQSNAI
jgi:hypothetical protein